MFFILKRYRDHPDLHLHTSSLPTRIYSCLRPRVTRGPGIASLALAGPDAGSDVAALSCSATPDGDDYVLNGRKTWISNGGIADFYCVFVRTGEAPGARGISAFVVDADTPGLTIAERIEVMAQHPLATLSFDQCRVSASQRDRTNKR